MNDSDSYQILITEYNRLLKDEWARNPPDGGMGQYVSYSAVRERLQQFCAATGKDMKLLTPVFQQEDIYLSNLSVPT